MKIPFDPVSLSPLITGLFRIWTWTIRYEPQSSWHVINDMNAQGQPLILALWHGEIFPVTSYGNTITSNLVTFVSESKDGEIIARILERLGHKTVRGSSSRGGVKALLKAKRIMEKDNRIAVFTIDGPKGPRHKTKDGIIFLAQRANAKIVPLRAFPSKKKVFEKSWDKFVLPYPFARCPVFIGEPMEVTREKLDANVMARERKRLEDRMHALSPAEKK